MKNNLTLQQRWARIRNRLVSSITNVLLDETPPGEHYMKSGTTATIEQIRAFGERHRLADILPYESFDPESELYFNEDTCGFVLECAPATSLTPDTLGALNSIFAGRHEAGTVITVHMVPETNIKRKLAIWREHNQNPPGEISDVLQELARRRIEYLKQGRWRSLFSDEEVLLRNYTLVLSYSRPVGEGVSPHELGSVELDSLRKIRQQISAALCSAHIPSVVMCPERLVNLLWDVLNPSNKDRKKLQYDENNLIRDQLVSADTVALFDAGCSSIIHEEECFSYIPFHVRQFPKFWPAFKNRDLIGHFEDASKRLTCPFIATLVVHVPDQVAEKGKAKQHMTRATQMADTPVAKYVQTWKDRKADWQFASEKLEAGNKMVESFFTVMLITPQGAEKSAEQQLKSLYESFGWMITKSRYLPQHSLLAALPMGISQDTNQSLRKLGMYYKRLSWSCTNMAPWLGEYRGGQSPLMLLISRRGQLSFFDNFDNDEGNYNMAVTAASGGGKSFFVNEVTTRTLGFGGKVFIFDAGHSYRNICNLLKGTYLNFERGNSICLNPFSRLDPSQAEHFVEDQLPLLKLLVCEMASPDNPLTAEERATIEMAIMASWEDRGNQSTITTVVEKLKTDVNPETGRTRSEADRLSRALYSYTKKGMYGRYFEGECNVNLSNRFVVLELDGLNNTPDLQSVALLVLMMEITNEMYLFGDKSVRKFCWIDEAWRLLGRGRAGDFIEEGYRVARKHGGAFGTITQKPSDYFQSDTAQAAYSNSDWAIYLRLKPSELQQSLEKGYINTSNGLGDLIRQLRTIQGKYSEMVIEGPSGITLNRFIVDPSTEKLYSTKGPEMQRIKNMREQGMGLWDAVDVLASESRR
ncbi:type IV secretion system protein TraC [uncultured Microbulbifer sp.]|uniref:type IV secretion system protein TraC n=1 Tax=uncultured Microbulbifer sp. TaxID=348147 RepID=UPI0026259410|nr:type IV secretion system protein TraC [uncultured Microbulbifer sp.]